MLLDLVIQGQLNDLPILDIVVVPSVVLEHRRVTRNNLKIVRIYISLFLRTVRVFQLDLFCRLESLGDPDHHSARILENVHVLGF